MAGAQRDTLSAPVGVFDSGVGGLTVLKELFRELPAERFIYFGDTANIPYGTRPAKEIRALTHAGVRVLLDQGVKLVVVACNTASVNAIYSLRERHEHIPFVAVVPAVKPAARASRARHIAVAATESSARGAFLQRLIDDFAHGVTVDKLPCQDLVTMVEAGQLHGPEVEGAIRAHLAPSLVAGIDQLVLGCTHFPAMRAAFEQVVGDGVAVVDSGAAVAKQARVRLEKAARLSPRDEGAAAVARPPGSGDLFLCSGQTAAFERAAGAILGHPVSAKQARSGFEPAE